MPQQEMRRNSGTSKARMLTRFVKVTAWSSPELQSDGPRDVAQGEVVGVSVLHHRLQGAVWSQGQRHMQLHHHIATRSLADSPT